MNTNSTTLIIEDNAGDAVLLKEQLLRVGWPDTNSKLNCKLNEAILCLQTCKPSIIFLDLNLPDSNGLETFLTINSMAPDIPIIILSGMNDTLLSVQAVKAGAQDFLVKGEFEEKILLKTILYGIERKKNQLKLEEANKRYQLASKATNDPLWDWDIKTNEIFWNDKVRIFGYHESMRKNDAWRSANIHPQDQARVQQELEECLAGSDEQWTCEYRFLCADGTYKHVFDRGYILRNQNNDAYRMIGTMQDLTERIMQMREMEEEKKQQQRDLIKATIDGQELERDFISKELHDNINQILTSANLYLNMIKSGSEPEVIEKVRTGRMYVQAAIEEIRKLTRAMSTSIIGDIGVIEAIQDLSEKINALKICRVIFIHMGDAGYIPSDLSLNIFRIIQEQLNNILKHSKAQVANVRVVVCETDVSVHISDNGIGTDLSQKKNGVGLSNIYNRVSSHNGHIEVASCPGKGFSIFIKFNF